MRHVRYWHLADIADGRLMSAFGGKADIAEIEPPCPLMTRSGHRPASRVAPGEAGLSPYQGIHFSRYYVVC